MVKLDELLTEKINPKTAQIDSVTTAEMVRLMNDEDKCVALAVEKELPQIAAAIDLITAQMQSGGRLIYCGAGTSGRLGVLDAVECRPTFGVPDTLVIGLMAGGEAAMFRAKEGAEDSQTLCIEDLKHIDFCEKDVLVGIAASGRTPYVLGGIGYANQLGAKTVGVCCNLQSPLHAVCTVTIAPTPGPEVIGGSTRMKAGTAQKMVLNMLSTGAMIRLGKVYGNLMVDVQATNEKLVQRAQNLVMQTTGVDAKTAQDTLAACQNSVKTAIVSLQRHCDAREATARLQNANGHITAALEG